MSLSVRVDPDLCMSSGLCVADHPALFRFDAAEIAEVVPGAEAGDAGAPRDAALREAAQRCPAEAILLTDAEEQPIDPFDM